MTSHERMSRRTDLPKVDSSLLGSTELIEYFSTNDISKDGKKLTIDRVEEQLVGQEQKLKKVVFFQDSTKALALNEINKASIEKVARDTNDGNWKDCRIELYPTTIEWNDVETPCIRVRLTTSKLVKLNKKRAKAVRSAMEKI